MQLINHHHKVTAKVFLFLAKLLCMPLAAGVSGGDVGLHHKNPRACELENLLCVCMKKQYRKVITVEEKRVTGSTLLSLKSKEKK